MSTDEFSCPRCRSNLYDPISGCLVCPQRGSSSLKAQREEVSPRILSEQKKLDESKHQRHLAKAKRLKEKNKLLAEAKRLEEHNMLLSLSGWKHEAKTERQKLLSKTRKTFSKKGIEGLYQGGQLYTYCPFCASSVKAGRMRKHIYNVHDNLLSIEDKAILAGENRTLQKKLVAEKPSQKPDAKRSTDSVKSRKEPNSKAIYYPADQYEHIKESFRQSLYDERDASRSYAHRFRENGKFGSHPLHDDYDDESFPD